MKNLPTSAGQRNRTHDLPAWRFITDPGPAPLTARLIPSQYKTGTDKIRTKVLTITNLTSDGVPCHGTASCTCAEARVHVVAGVGVQSSQFHRAFLPNKREFLRLSPVRGSRELPVRDGIVPRNAIAGALIGSLFGNSGNDVWI